MCNMATPTELESSVPFPNQTTTEPIAPLKIGLVQLIQATREHDSLIKFKFKKKQPFGIKGISYY